MHRSSSPSELRYRIGGMDCAACAAKLERALERLPGLANIRVNASTGALALNANEAMTSRVRIERTISGLGYTIAAREEAQATKSRASAEPSAAQSAIHNDGDGHDRGHLDGIADGRSWWQSPKGRLVIAAGLSTAAAFVASYVAPGLSSWLYIAATLIGVLPVARRAIAAAQAGVFFTIEMLMTIAAFGALAIGAAEEAAVVVFLFAIGELLEGVAAQSARSSIRKLGDLVPSRAALLVGPGQMHEVETSELKVGDKIIVRPGDRLPADGTIVEGASDIDEAPVTGESIPRTKSVGADVFAGSINKTAALTVTVTRPSADNTIARIIRMVDEAQEAKAPFERFIDRFSRWYMPAIVTLALLVAILPPLLMGQLWSTWIYRALALLLIGCPCALVIATPAAIAASLATGARRGLLMKGGAVIEAASKITEVAFDKTGTLTEGRPKVTDVRGFGRSETELLTLIASLEVGSSHPIAMAILERAKADGIKPLPAMAITAVAGEGMTGTVDGRTLFLGAPQHAAARASMPADVKVTVEALQIQGKTVSILVENQTMLGLVAVRDEPRVGVAAAVRDLKSLGIVATMLTGDNKRTAHAIAGNLGLEYAAELMPDDKVRLIRERAATNNIAMVGDGINDAPALAAASVGIAMGGGTGVALETADAALVGDRVSGVAELIRLARRTMGIIHQNVAIALGLKAIFLLTTIIGTTGLWLAVIADTGATVLVTLNALRLLGGMPSTGRQAI